MNRLIIGGGLRNDRHAEQLSRLLRRSSAAEDLQSPGGLGGEPDLHVRVVLIISWRAGLIKKNRIRFLKDR